MIEQQAWMAFAELARAPLASPHEILPQGNSGRSMAKYAFRARECYAMSTFVSLPHQQD